MHNECYHLWFHPENFGEHPKENLNNLLQILEQYRKCASLYDMQSWNMGEYAKNLLVETKKQKDVQSYSY